MAILNVVRWSQLDTSSRLDAEYYQPENLRLLEILLRTYPQRVAQFADVTDGIHASPDCAEQGGIRYLSAKCVRENSLDLADTLSITNEQHSSNLRSALKAGDVLITTVGTIGNAAVVPPEILPANIDRHVGLIRIFPASGVDPWYLAAFLNSKYGRFQTVREATGNVQLNLFIKKIKQLWVPKLECSPRIAAMAKAAYAATKNAKAVYAEAEAEMLGRMQWERLANEKRELFFVEDYAATVQAGRCDAEHFHPHGQHLRQVLRKLGANTIGEFCPKPHRGMQPEFTDGGDTWVIDSKAVRPQEFQLTPEQRTRRDLLQDAEFAKAQVRYGDVLLNSTGRGTLGRAGCYLRHELAIADNHVSILRPNRKICLPLYLSLFLNSAPGMEQSEAFQAGSSGQLELYPTHISKFLVFLPKNKDGQIDIEWQQELAKRLERAQHAQFEGWRKANDAKLVVEREVERTAVNVVA